MSSRARAAADRIREKVSVVKVLSALGYEVRTDADDREQQFRCDLHGTGHDDKPSARVYPDSNSWYCFGCGVTRDPIETIRAKQGVGFWQAVKILEQAFGLDPLPIDYGADERGDTALQEVQDNLTRHTTYEDEEKRTQRLLDGFTADRDLSLDRLLSFWAAFDKVVYHVRGPRGDGGVWSEGKGKQMMTGLRTRILDAIKEDG
jgi:DNA primase